MKTLVYTVGYGDCYFDLACMMAHTCRIYGYTQDILIFATSDRTSKYADVLNVRTHPKGPLLESGRGMTFHGSVPKHFGYEPHQGAIDYFLPKMILGQFVDLASYDFVLYIDSDILVRAPLDPIWQNTGMVGSFYRASFFRSLKSLKNRLEPSELERAKSEVTLGSGIFGLPKAHYGFFDEFHSIYMETLFETPHDAPAFTLALFRGGDKYRPVMLPRRQFSHYWGHASKKNKMMAEYQRCFADKVCEPIQ